MERAERVDLLMKRITEFARQNPQLETQEGAFLQCDTMTYKFLAWLKPAERTALEIQDYSFTCETEENPKPDLYKGYGTKNDIMQERQSSWHCILSNPDFFVDFTARQYFSTAAYPTVIPREGYLQMAAEAGVTE